MRKYPLVSMLYSSTVASRIVTSYEYSVVYHVCNCVRIFFVDYIPISYGLANLLTTKLWFDQTSPCAAMKFILNKKMTID